MDVCAAGMESDSEDEYELSFADDKTIDEVDIYEEIHKSSKFQTETATISSKTDKNRASTGSIQGSICSENSTDDRRTQRRYINDICLGIPAEDLRVSVVHGNLDTVASIIEKGFEVDTVLKAGWTALMYACSCGHPRIVKFLLDKGADANFQKDSFTPMMAVCTSKHHTEEDLLLCVSYLMEFKADIKAVDNYRMTSLMFACRGGFESIVKRLLEHGAEINGQDARGWTPLAWAASRGQKPIVRLLLVSGASPSQRNRAGQSVSDIAQDCGFPDVARFVDTFASTGKLGEFETVSRPVEDVPRKDKKFIKYGDLEMFLSALGLSEYIPAFIDHGVTCAQFLTMSDHDLERVGVDKVGARKLILDSVHSTHKQEWQKSSLPRANRNRHFTCPEMISMMSNIADHVSYIDATLSIVTDQIRNCPESLEVGQDEANVTRLLKEISRSCGNVKNLNERALLVKDEVQKISNNPLFEEVGLIKGAAASRKSSKLPQVLKVVIACTLLASLVWKKTFILSKFPL